MTSRLTETLAYLLTKVQQMEARLTLLEGQVFSERATEAASPIGAMSAANAKAYESVGLAAMKGIKKSVYLAGSPHPGVCSEHAASHLYRDPCTEKSYRPRDPFVPCTPQQGHVDWGGSKPDKLMQQSVHGIGLPIFLLPASAFAGALAAYVTLQRWKRQISQSCPSSQLAAAIVALAGACIRLARVNK